MTPGTTPSLHSLFSVPPPSPSAPTRSARKNSKQTLRPSIRSNSKQVATTFLNGPMASAKETYRAELRTAARQLGERCLYTAAKWYAPPGQPPPQTLNP